MDTFLNDVKFTIGSTVEFTEEGFKSIKDFVKQYPTIARRMATFEILTTSERKALCDLTECYELTKGATKLKDTQTGEVFEITPDFDHNWAFFTEATPHFFNLLGDPA